LLEARGARRDAGRTAGDLRVSRLPLCWKREARGETLDGLPETFASPASRFPPLDA
jgi:hypothetical protein